MTTDLAEINKGFPKNDSGIWRQLSELLYQFYFFLNTAITPADTTKVSSLYCAVVWKAYKANDIIS